MKNIKLNIGTGKGTSVLEIVKAFKDILNLDVSYKFHKRRKGDYPCVVADNTKVKYILGWKPKKNLADMCKDSWNWNLKKGKEK